LQASKDEAIDVPPFFAQPFIDGVVQAEGMPAFASTPEVYQWLAHTAEQGGQTKQLRTLAGESLIHYKTALAAELIAEKPAAAIDPAIAAAQSIVLEPEATLEHFAKLQLVRDTVRAEYKQHKLPYGSWDVADEAKLAILEIYLGKVNDQIANYWPRIGQIQDQALATGNDELWLRAAQALPSWKHQAILAEQEDRRSFYRRLDYVRHGMGHDGEGEPHAVEYRLRQLAAAAMHQVGRPPEKPPVFTREQEAEMRAIKVTPDNHRDMFVQLLSQTDKLSIHNPDEEGPNKYTPDRTHPAADGKWQVVFHPTKKSYKVDSVAKVVMISPEDVSLYNVLVVGTHEAEHVNQGDADSAIGQQLQIANLKGKRVGPLREGKANEVQREGELQFFGHNASRTPAMTYAGAVEASWERHDLVASAVAFYRARREATPGSTALGAAKEAADRAIRQLRGDTTNTQALSYDEYQLLVDAVAEAPQSVRDRAAQVTCFDLPDQLRLHKYGLLPVPPHRLEFTPIILELVKAYYEKVTTHA
ncbi:MAG TPA: hypothetical protein VD735_01700, partial [Candidatus Saccharimonadales bacterium]|nr:hypothetical protein [Candidatus Saccharimonadales bacterium]